MRLSPPYPGKYQSERSLKLDLLYKNIQKDLDKVEEKLRLFSYSSNALISEIGTYLFHKAGKRIRPALLVLSSKLFGYKGEKHHFWAALVEIIHTASLIHDDLIDNSKTRRGRQSVHTKWGPNITVLLGDYLYIKSIGLSLHNGHRKINRILADTSANMIEGELAEYYMSGNPDLNEEDYLEIIHKKTASLFSASCQIGGILGKASAEEEKHLADYGANLGMSFQITDDLLDFNGDEKILGKPILSDLSEGRITLPLIYTLNNDGKAQRAQIAKLLKKKTLEKNSRDEILQIVKANGALDYTYGKAKEFSRRSKEIISQFPRSCHRETLSLFAEFVLNRKN